VIQKGSKVRYVIPQLGITGVGTVTSVIKNGRCFVKDDDSIMVAIVKMENVEEV